MMGDDRFASIIDDCLYSSSQEEFLRHSRFAREDKIFAEDHTAPLNSGRIRAGDAAGGSNPVELTDFDGKMDLGIPEGTKRSRIEVGFGGEFRVGEVSGMELGRDQVGLGENFEEGRSIKKSRVSGLGSEGGKFGSLVRCDEKLVKGSEDRNKEIVVYSGGLKFEMVRPLRWVEPQGVKWSGKVVVQDEKSNPVKRVLEFEDNMVTIDAEEVGTIEPRKNKEVGGDVIGKHGKGVENPNDGSKSNEKGDIVGKGDGDGKGVENRNDGSKSIEKIENRGKRVLPRRRWGLNVDESDEMRNGALRKHGEENVGRVVEENEGQKSKTDHCGTPHKDGSVNEIKNQGYRVLPPSLVEQIQDVGESGGSENGGSRTHNKQKDQRKAAEKRGKKSKTEDESLKRLVDVLKLLAARNPPDDDDYDGEVDIIETAKKKGMSFPCNRYLVSSEKRRTSDLNET